MVKVILSAAILVFVCTQNLMGQSDIRPRYDESMSNSASRKSEQTTGKEKAGKSKKIKKSKSESSGINDYYDSKVDEYLARMAENAKREKKIQKDMEKPQFSDPTYFGHKHPPKKRRPGKKKFCKECQLVH